MGWVSHFVSSRWGPRVICLMRLIVGSISMLAGRLEIQFGYGQAVRAGNMVIQSLKVKLFTMYDRNNTARMVREHGMFCISLTANLLTQSGG